MQSEENSQRGKKNNRNQTQQKQETNNQNKIDSIIVAKQLIIAKQEAIGQWLLQFRKLKNPNYQKFQDKILDNLGYNKFSEQQSIKRFIAISFAANEQNTTGNQMTHIFKGFVRYWKSLQLRLQAFEQLFHHYYQLYKPISKIFANFCRGTIEKKFDDRFDYFQKIALEMSNYFLKSNRKGDQLKAIALIYEFNLYNQIQDDRIIDILMNEQNIKEVAYAFTDYQGNLRVKLFNSFMERCIVHNDKNDMAKCQKVIRELNLNPQNYPQYMRKLHEKYIGYQIRTYKLFQIELIIQHDLRLIKVLIDELKAHKRLREMKYFIVKYNLQEQYSYNLDQKEREQLSKIKNILLDCDQFGPTEIEVLQQEQDKTNYLYMKDFGIEQNQVLFVDCKNIRQINIEQEFSLLKVGIDSQRSGGIHVFDPSETQIIQIFTGKRVLIFDYKDLKLNETFKKVMLHLFTYCKLYGQDIKKEITQFKDQLQLEIQQKVMQQLMKNRIFDIGKHFKEVFPKETKSNLAYMCQVVFQKNLSKYEQCSGWKGRPLRKAQLHYAALDCVVPYKLYEKLSK